MKKKSSNLRESFLRFHSFKMLISLRVSLISLAHATDCSVHRVLPRTYAGSRDTARSGTRKGAKPCQCTHQTQITTPSDPPFVATTSNTPIPSRVARCKAAVTTTSSRHLLPTLSSLLYSVYPPLSICFNPLAEVECFCLL